MRQYFVYLLTSRSYTALYTGVTSRLEARTWEHKMKSERTSFTSRYNLNILVY